jgi:hypothetical protein
VNQSLLHMHGRLPPALKLCAKTRVRALKTESVCVCALAARMRACVHACMRMCHKPSGRTVSFAMTLRMALTCCSWDFFSWFRSRTWRDHTAVRRQPRESEAERQTARARVTNQLLISLDQLAVAHMEVDCVDVLDVC